MAKIRDYVLHDGNVRGIIVGMQAPSIPNPGGSSVRLGVLAQAPAHRHWRQP